MANEITISVSLVAAKGAVSESLVVTRLQANMTGTRMLHNVQNIGTSIEVINVGDLVAPGIVLFINRGPTNYVELYDAIAGNVFSKLLVNEAALLRLGSAAPAAKANTAAVDLEYLLIDT